MYRVKIMKLQGEYITDKQLALQSAVRYMLNRTLSMFKYNGLPDEIPEEKLEEYLQTNGHAVFLKIGEYFGVLKGVYGPEIDLYERPKFYIVTNTSLESRLSMKYEIDKECVVIRNDTLEIGLLPLFLKYCNLLCETDLSIRSAVINSRMVALLSANDEKTKRSAEIYLQKILNGENAIIAANPFFDGLKTQNVGSTQNLIQALISLHEYLKVCMYNELGLTANLLNQKRENITVTEAQLSDDFLLPLVDNMKANRVCALEKINRFYGLNISVELSSTWRTNELENEKQKMIYEEKVNDNE